MLFYKRSVLYLFLAILLIFQMSCSSQEKTVADHLSRGEQYFAKGEYKAAILEFRNVVSIEPKNSQAQYKLGLAYIETKEPSLAFQQLQRAASLDPTNIDANLKVAELYFIANELQDAQRHIDSVLEQQSGNVDGLMLRAKLLTARQQHDEALTIIDSILARDSKKVTALEFKARVLVATKQYGKAEEVLRQAITQDQNNVDLHKKLVSLYFLDNRSEDAAVHLQKMVPLFPDSLEAKLGLASFQIRSKEFAEAEKTINSALESNPKNEQVYVFAYNTYRYTSQLAKAEQVLEAGIKELVEQKFLCSLLADLYFETGKSSKSIELVNKVLAEDSSFSPAKLIQAKHFLQAGKTQNSYEIVTSLIKERPEWSDPYIVQSIILAQNGKFNAALLAAEMAVKHGAGNAKAHHQLALLYLQGKEFALGEKEAVLSLQLQPGNWQTYFTLAKCLAGKNEYEKALMALSELHERRPTDPDILLLRGDCYLALGKKGQAKADFTMVLQLDPSFTQALARLVKMERAAGGDFAKVKHLLDRQIAKSKNPGHLFLLGTYLLENKKYDEALATFKEVKEINPQFIDAYDRIARIYLLRDYKEKAIGEYRSSLAINPASIGTMMNLAQLLGKTGNADEARSLYEKIIEINPGFAPAANGLALVHSREGGDLGLALYFAKSAQASSPNDPYIADTLGWVYYKRGSYAIALTELKRASEALPGNQEVKEHLALAEEALKNEKRRTEMKVPDKVELDESLSIGNVKATDFKLD